MDETTSNPILGDRFLRAIGYATQHHAHQVRKGTNIPYISHLLQVAGLVLEAGGGEDAAVAALLHDAIEDADDGQAPRVRKEILEQFGERVLEIVEKLTDADVQPKPPWRERKEQYLEHLQAETDSDVLLTSCADKLHNARAIVRDLRVEGPSVWKRFKGKKDGTLWYYRSLVEIYHASGGGSLFREFESVVNEMAALAQDPSAVPY